MKEEKIIKGNDASQLLENQQFQEALSFLENEYTKLAAISKDQEVRNKGHYLLTAMQDFRSHLKQVIVTGKLASREIQRLNGNKGIAGLLRR